MVNQYLIKGLDGCTGMLSRLKFEKDQLMQIIENLELSMSNGADQSGEKPILLECMITLSELLSRRTLSVIERATLRQYITRLERAYEEAILDEREELLRGKT